MNPFPGAQSAKGAIRFCEPLVDLLRECCVTVVEDRPHAGDGCLRTIHIRLEVEQVGVRKDVFFSGDLGSRYLVEGFGHRRRPGSDRPRSMICDLVGVHSR
jgi:hypothetical protein